MTVRNFNLTPKAKARLALQSDPIYIALKNATPEQIGTWVDENMATLASARKLFKTILLHMKAN